MPVDGEVVTMERADLLALPSCDLPGGFTIRAYRTGDEKNWLAIHTAADRFNAVSEGTFRFEFGEDEDELASRQFYLCDGDRTVGTCSAWDSGGQRDGSYGRIHWLAIVPEYQGRGLSKPLLLCVCRRMVELGHDKVWLTTSTGRPVAIRLYESFGFKIVDADA